jgi:hypothetical protein
MFTPEVFAGLQFDAEHSQDINLRHPTRAQREIEQAAFALDPSEQKRFARAGQPRIGLA